MTQASVSEPSGADAPKNRTGRSKRSSPFLESLVATAEPLVAQDPPARRALREQALDALRRDGLPNRRTEDWRATPLKPILAGSIGMATNPGPVPKKHVLSKLAELGLRVDGEPCLVSYNGTVLPSLSSAPTALADVKLQQLGGDAVPGLGALAPNQHFVAVNNAAYSEAWAAEVRGAEDKVLHMIHLFAPGSTPQMFHPRLWLDVLAASTVTLIETFVVLADGASETAESDVAPMLINPVTELQLGPQAQVLHSRHVEVCSLDGRANGAGTTRSNGPVHVLSTVAVKQANDSNYQAEFVSLGGALNRLDLYVDQPGDHASCGMDCVYFADGNEHVEQQVRVTHVGKHGASHQHIRGLVGGAGVGLFNGVVAVKAGASHADAHQEARTLLLSDDAVGYAKPHLEIDTDEVACSHGATVGTLDDEALFYLRSRGIPEDAAQGMLTFSFASEVLDHGADTERSRWLLRRILERVAVGVGHSHPGTLAEAVGLSVNKAPESDGSAQTEAADSGPSGKSNPPRFEGSTPPPLPLDVAAIRREFPALAQEIHGKPLVYLDSAATALKPQSVIDAVVQVLGRDTANVHRAVHTLSQRATLAYEGVRDKVAALIGASSSEEVVYQRGTTEAMNLVAEGFGRPRLKRRDEVILTGLEHHATIVPWQRLAKRIGVKLRVVEIGDDGEVAVDAVRKALRKHTRFIVMSHVSNTLGTILPVREICELAKGHGDVTVVVDGAQAVAHLPVDVADLGCDFYAFSAHKMYGPSGAGVLWGRRELLQKMEPLLTGGDMIDTVSFEETSYADPPHRFEAGTPAISAVIGMGAAVDFLRELGMGRVHRHDQTLVREAYGRLSAVDGLRLLGWPKPADFDTHRVWESRVPVFSFVFDGIHPADLGSIVDLAGVAIRTGHHCAMPLMETLGVNGSARASAGIYNTAEDFDALVLALEKARRMLS